MQVLRSKLCLGGWDAGKRILFCPAGLLGAVSQPAFVQFADPPELESSSAAADENWEDLSGYRFSALSFSFPILPFGPTTKGSEMAFQFRSASAGSCRPASGRTARQFFPSSVETSVPFGPTVIHVLAVLSYATEERNPCGGVWAACQVLPPSKV